MIQVNLTGTIYCVYRFTKTLIEKSIPGSIVLISSEAARFGGNHISTYAATKAGLNTFVVGAAREIGPYGIRINAVSPGTIMTDSLEAEGDEKLKQIKNSIPLGRIGTTDEASETIHWLLSNKSSYISGSMITVSGGR
jgi:NAD(P)-dependent dehydrogenase (short-subunit alcohol dehydrogenase family)